MADNTILPLTGSGDATVTERQKDRSGVKTQIVALDLNPAGSEALMANVMPTVLTTADLDTGGGTDTRAVVGLVLAESGGGLLVGSANPIPVSFGGGTTPYTLISAGSTNATSVKAAAGVLYHVYVSNKGGTIAYLKFYDKASAPTVGTDTPILNYLVPAYGAAAVPVNPGYTFSTGIAFALTGDYPVADTTIVAAGQVLVNLGYV